MKTHKNISVKPMKASHRQLLEVVASQVKGKNLLPEMLEMAKKHARNRKVIKS